jgi:hypothetical protein
LQAQSGLFTLKFEGLTDGSVIRGNYSGRATTATFTGTWTADASTNGFGTTPNPVTDGDILGNAMLEGLRTATRYDGDYINLRIHFKRGASERYLLFRPQP